MEHILISPGKIKLLLTKEDMERYELASAVESEEIGVGKSFKALIDDVKKVGFDAGTDENGTNDRLFIQLYPSKDGGAEVYITNLGEREDTLKRTELPILHIGCFASLDDLAGCCKQLENFGGESSAWEDERGGRWFLILSELVDWRDYLERGLFIEAVIGEFGRIIKSSGAVYYIKEHCFNFCEKKAVKILKSVI